MTAMTIRFRPTFRFALDQLRSLQTLQAAGSVDLADLQRWLDTGLIRHEDLVVAARWAALQPARPATEVLLAAALCMRTDRDGHVFLDLHEPPIAWEGLVAAAHAAGLSDEALQAMKEAPSAWAGALASATHVVGVSNDGPVNRPLVLADDRRLYLSRMWAAEQRVLAFVRQRVGQGDGPPDPEGWQALEAAVLGCIQREESPALQQDAVRRGVRAGMLVLTGGPGTGKTYTVRALLTLAWLRHLKTVGPEGPPFSVRLAAPTGKAAARMKDSIQTNLDGWVDAVRKALKKARLADAGPLADQLHSFLLGLEASTLHRLLGYRSEHPLRFRHQEDNPLPAHMVVVDEASMVDLHLMDRLMAAVGPESRLVLVGDRRQLASVDAGTVLADLCRAGSGSAWVVELQHSVRFDPGSAVGLFASGCVGLDGRQADEVPGAVDALVREFAAREQRVEGRPVPLWIEYRAPRPEDPASTEAPAAAGLTTAVRAVASHWAVLLSELDALGPLPLHDPTLATEMWKKVRERMQTLQMLTAHRRGPTGVPTLNAQVWDALRRHGRRDGDAGDASAQVPKRGFTGELDAERWGRPVMVTRNDHDLQLYNGDMGLMMEVKRTLDEPARLQAVFNGPGDAPRAVEPALIPPHETVYAMTIHKSQGSEFDHVVLVLPPEVSMLLTRELLYTGVTRARNFVTVVGDEAIMRDGLQRQVRRASWLGEALTKPG